MNKPLKDWTLGEIKAECEKHKQGCEPCPFYHVLDDVSFSSNCKARQLVNKCPDDWDLSESPRWTKNEIRMAKAIKAIWPEAEDIRARNGTTSAIEYRVCAGRVVLGVIYAGYFPTMRCGEDYSIDEIIGGAG